MQKKKLAVMVFLSAAVLVAAILAVTGCKSRQEVKEVKTEMQKASMIRIPAGEFLVGEVALPSGLIDKPTRKILVNDFSIDTYEVTNEQFKKFCDETGRSYPDDPGFTGMDNYFANYRNYPVVNVTWQDADAYCKWAGKRLPAEAEWEKAARGPDGNLFPWGNVKTDGTQCNTCDVTCDFSWKDSTINDNARYTTPVGNYPAGRSPYGAMDMAGNVWEWCADIFNENTPVLTPDQIPSGAETANQRVIRGGSWYNQAWYSRCAHRAGFPPAGKSNSVGFRCAGK
jgi:formylglycine-generating enzyme required for sulfatase activity